jgi:hypothetical protein
MANGRPDRPREGITSANEENRKTGQERERVVSAEYANVFESAAGFPCMHHPGSGRWKAKLVLLLRRHDVGER